MASLIDGKISDEPIAKVNLKGEFQRNDSKFRNTIDLHLQLSRDRYQLFASYACPWAHRTLIVRKLKQLENIIELSISEPFMGEKGWSFESQKDPKYLADLYIQADPHYTGKVSVPVLWDKYEKTIINNESSEIIRIFNSAFNEHTNSSIDLFPDFLQDKINHINHKVYHNINNGVYKCGFARSQAAYELSFERLFLALEEIEKYLGREKYLAGDFFTEADVRLFTTLYRFDAVYVGHFKCNKQQISSFPNLHAYLKAIYQLPQVKTTCRMDHIKEHYYTSHTWINPNKIIPKGPDLDFDSPHNRGPIKFWRSTH